MLLWRMAFGSTLCIAFGESFRTECDVEGTDGAAGAGPQEHIPQILDALNMAYNEQALNASWMSLDSVEVAREHLKHAKGSKEELAEDTYLYGEIHPSSTAALLRCLGLRPGARYYDLGSGTGKTVLVAALLGLNATGVEVVEKRSLAAQEAARRVGEKGVAKDIIYIAPSFLHGSLLDVDFSDADIIFANSVLFPEELMEGFSRRAEALRPGSWVVSYWNLLGPCFRSMGQFSGSVTWQAEGLFTWKVQQALCGRRALGAEEL
ncbi:DOT1 [Symbiodinium microadriaticum]|nr:DOT1 [Symbiodinium microadriaticum]CAE7942275.1 DOT1 [Symbiodinium sp. KB8]